MLAIYLRKSRERKNEKSLKEQRLLGIEFAQSNNMEYHLYDEGIVSGTGSKERPEFNKLIADIENGKVTGLFVWETSRLARDEGAWNELAKLLRSKGILLYDNGVEVDFNEENNFLFYTIKSGMDAHFARVTAKKIKTVLNRNAREGKVNGLQAYGYYLDDNGRPQLDEEQAEVVKKIFDLYIEGKGHYAIADYLNAQGFGKRKRKTKKKEEKWSYATVRSMLLNETYTGKGKYNDIEVKYPVIIEKKVFDKAMSIRKGKGRLGKRTSKVMLSNAIICGKCGERYGPEIRKDKQYYSCSSRYLSRYLDDRERCGNGQIRGEYLDTIIFVGVLLNKIYKKVAEEFKQGGNSELKNELKNKKKYIEGNISELHERQKRNYAAYTKGIASLELFDEQQKEIEKGISKNEDELEAVKEHLDKINQSERLLVDIDKDLGQSKFINRKLNLLENKKAISKIPLEEKKKMVDKYIKSITVISKQHSNIPISAEVEFKLPISPVHIKIESRYYCYQIDGVDYISRDLGKYPKNVVNRIRREGHFLQGYPNFKEAHDDLFINFVQ